MLCIFRPYERQMYNISTEVKVDRFLLFLILSPTPPPPPLKGPKGSQSRFSSKYIKYLRNNSVLERSYLGMFGPPPAVHDNKKCLPSLSGHLV